VKTSLALLVFTLIASAPLRAGAMAQVADADVTVREQDGIYHVAAMFNVEETPQRAFTVLTGYEQIPRYMPDVRRSRVIERGEGRAVVEQEAEARVLMFSKRIHLVLDVSEGPETIRFRDRCGKSFAHYEGAWTLTAAGANRVTVRYELAAKPAFDVPEFLLKRLLRRDAQEMIRRLREEMTRPR
jgi:ribosome-associated toxin RatA of RatAB toxin-antitoxin module